MRQVDDRSRDHALVRAGRGANRLRRRGRDPPEREAAASASPTDADGLSGSVRLAQPEALGRSDRRRADAGPRPRDEARHRQPGARAARHRRVAGGRRLAVTRTSSRAASGSGSASPARSGSTPTSSSRTSRSPRSTSRSRRRSSICSSRSRTSSTSPISSSRTTSQWSGTRPTGSRSCTWARSSRSRPPTSSTGGRCIRTRSLCSRRSRSPTRRSSVGERRSCFPGTCPRRPTRPTGCRFHTRCPFVQPTRCRDEVPSLRAFASGHTVACHWVERDRGGRDPAARSRAGLPASPAGAGSRASSDLNRSGPVNPAATTNGRVFRLLGSTRHAPA